MPRTPSLLCICIVCPPPQVNELGASAISPFQRLGGDLSNSIAGGFDSLKSGAQGAVEGAQTQLGETVTESIGNPLQVSSACQLGHRRNRRCTFHVRAGMTGRVLVSTQ